MLPDTTLIQCLEYACSVEGNLQSVELSKYIERHSPLPVLLMCMQLIKRRLNQNLDVMMSHQQGKSLEVMMMTINLNVTSVD